MDGLILAAGMGTRLRALGPSKPLVTLGGMTLLERVMRTMALAGIPRFVIVTGHQDDRVRFEAERVAADLGRDVAFAYNAQWDRPNGLSVLAAKPALKTARFLLSMCDHVVTSVLIERVMSAAQGLDDEATYLGVDYRLDNPDVDLDDVTRVNTRGGAIMDIGKGLQAYNAYDCGVFLAHTHLIDAIEDNAKAGRGESLSDGMRSLAKRTLAKTQDIGDAFWIDVDDEAAYKRAERYVINDL